MSIFSDSVADLTIVIVYSFIDPSIHPAIASSIQL